MAGTSRHAITGRTLDTVDGLQLNVQERGQPDAPTVLALHGYPDDHTVWDGVAEVLAERYHVVTYDVRGAGSSGAPAHPDGYRVDLLADDLRRVADAVSPDAAVHLLAHDWGSVQTWHAVTDPAHRDRFASFTSISGPCLDHIGHWVRGKLRGGPKSLAQLAKQLVFSGYIGFFQLPKLPELAWRSGLMNRLIAVLERLDRGSAGNRTVPVVRDGLNGLSLYRANSGVLTDPGERSTDVPVQVLAPSGDPFVSPALQTEVGRWVADLRVRRLPGGHWVPRTRPDLIAWHTADFVEHVRGERS
ncbi:hypothetical protein GCM10009854_31990 [Saccharopolyspora halophila]|uniref:AB hydrolase-1 domain-containing protein n=1 Tax=Saccharopolyspora halophila TaxID=405551 RepID=A0ABN3GHK5_9PSEU